MAVLNAESSSSSLNPGWRSALSVRVKDSDTWCVQSSKAADMIPTASVVAIVGKRRWKDGEKETLRMWMIKMSRT